MTSVPRSDVGKRYRALKNMQNSKRFLVLNAFAVSRYGGNPAAVFTDARGLPEQELQLIARQLNLIETVFAYPVGADGVDYHLRYFTPLEELPVAGHPTVAAWAALARLGLIDTKTRSKFIQKTGAGNQEITVEEAGDSVRISMKQPAARFTNYLPDLSEVATSIGLMPSDLDSHLPIQGVSVGLGHIIVPVKDLATLMRAKMNIPAVENLCAKHGMREMQLFVFQTNDSNNDLFTRNFTPREGLEDPACGNGNGALGAYLAETKYKGETTFDLRAEQGHGIKMPSLIEILVRRQGVGTLDVSIAGCAMAMVEGQLVE